MCELIARKLLVIANLKSDETLSGFQAVKRSGWSTSLWRTVTGETIITTISELNNLYIEAINSKVLTDEIFESIIGLETLRGTYANNIEAVDKLNKLIATIKNVPKVVVDIDDPADNLNLGITIENTCEVVVQNVSSNSNSDDDYIPEIIHEIYTDVATPITLGDLIELPNLTMRQIFIVK